MTVAELKKALAKVPDEMEVLRDGGNDHSYLKVRWAGEMTVGYFDKQDHYCEWHSVEHASEGEVTRDVFVLGCG